MKLYELRNREKRDPVGAFERNDRVPGFTVSELLDLFYAEGVTPSFAPADLGTDEVTEVDGNGRMIVDPFGDIRTDSLDLKEMQLTRVFDDDKQPVVSGDFENEPPEVDTKTK